MILIELNLILIAWIGLNMILIELDLIESDFIWIILDFDWLNLIKFNIWFIKNFFDEIYSINIIKQICIVLNQLKRIGTLSVNDLLF